MTLKKSDIERALRMNEIYHRQDKAGFEGALGYLGLKPHADPADIVLAVYEYQAKQDDLVDDGILGPKTVHHVYTGEAIPAVADSGEYLIVDGKKIKTKGLRVVSMGMPTGLDLKAVTARGWGHRKAGAKVDLFVLHWDEAWSSHGCFNTLVERGTGTHLGIDKDGTVYQWLDLALSAWGQNHVNDRAIGVEINNPVEVSRQGKYGQPIRPIETIGVAAAGNVKKKVLGFTDEQKKVTVQLAEEICRIFKIPRVLPGLHTVMNDVMPGGKLDGKIRPGHFSGVCGHYHVTDQKVDPGMGLWPAFLEAGFKVA